MEGGYDRETPVNNLHCNFSSIGEMAEHGRHEKSNSFKLIQQWLYI